MVLKFTIDTTFKVLHLDPYQDIFTTSMVYFLNLKIGDAPVFLFCLKQK